jgi:hypothetical protein
MTQKIIVVGDVHNHFVQAQMIIDKYVDTHKIVMVGDYFDDFGDSAVEADQTARWLKSILDHPNIVALMGNHDINYSYLNYKKDSKGNLQNLYHCSGYDLRKDDAINRIMTNEDWDKIKMYHYENGWFFTHAGISKHWFEHPVLGTTPEVIIKKLDEAIELYKNREYSDVLGAAGRCRGGPHRAGGILWHDHFREAEPIRGIKQVYGHTPVTTSIGPCIDIYKEEDIDAVNVNVDCGLQEVFRIHEDGSAGPLKTDLPNFYYEAKKKEFDKMIKDMDAYHNIYKDLK